MRTWAFLLGGLLVWAVHFFGLYLFASIWLDSLTTRVLTLALTFACLAADGLMLGRSIGVLRTSRSDVVDHWTAVVATLALAFSALAVFWQGLPALLA